MESLADMGLATMRRFKRLQELELGSTEDQSHEWPKQLLLAQFDRFELWAVNLGVFVMGHGSLDYRIRDSESMKEAILQMMKNLNRSLDEALAYLDGSIEQEDEDEDEDSCSELESDMDLLLDSIKDPIDRLYKMAVWIRNPATRIPSTKARNLRQVDEETNVDLFKSFENFDYDHVSSLFLEYEKNKALQEDPISQPHDAVGDGEALVEDQLWEPIRKTLELNRLKISSGNESYLVRRIARANGLRRQQFAYWRKHKNKLREHAANVVEDPTHNLPTTSHIIQLKDKNEKFKAPLTVTTATQLRLSHETGKELGKENVMTLAVSEYAPSAWNPSKDIVSFPPAPKISTGNEFFECPYCYTICPASILSEKAWRAHLIRDLRPYICTFEHCLNSEQLYDSRDDWIQHETSTHQTVFRCPLHEEETFTTLAAYEEHTRKYHNEDAMPSSFATSTATNIYRSCPICSIVLGTTQKLQSHIALHLERFAMFSLPRRTDDDNEGSSGGRSASALFDSNRSFNEDPDRDSNAAGRDEETNTTNDAIIEQIRLYTHDVVMLRSNRHTESYGTEKDDEYFLEIMAQARCQFSRYGEDIRGLPPNDKINNLLFNFGEACLGCGLVGEAIETLEHLRLIQSGLYEHDEPRLLLTNQQLALAYQVEEALQEARELFREDPKIYDKPINTKALHIFARTEATKRHAQTIWGPSIWKTQQGQKELEHGDDPDSFSQRPVSSRSFDGEPLPIPVNKLEELPPLAQNEDARPEEVYTQARSQAQHQAPGPQQTHDKVTLRGQLYNHARLVYNRLMTEAAYQFSGSENIPQDTVDRIIQQSFVQAKRSVRDSVRRKAQQQQQIIAEESNYNTPHAGQDLETPEDIPGFDSRRFNELMEQLFEEIDVDENLILGNSLEDRNDHLQRDMVGNSKSESAGAEGELKSDLLDEEDQNQISEADKSEHRQPQEMSPIARDDYGNRDEGSDVQEGIDHADHSRQDPSRANHDRRVPIDPPGITELYSERYFEKLRQVQDDYQRANPARFNVTTTETASEFILPLRDSSNPTDEKPLPSARGKESFLSIGQKAAADASDDLNAVSAIAEQETTNNPHQPVEYYNYTRMQENIESEELVCKEMYKALEDECSTEIEHAAKDTELKLEAQTLAQILAHEIVLHKSSVQELKAQFLLETRRLEKDEKASAWMNKVRSFDFLTLRDMIKEIQKKREARETPEVQQARQAREAREAQEAQIIRQIADANFELRDHKERKQRFIERGKKILEAIHADRGQEDSSAAPGELEARAPSTEVSLRTETSKSELNFHGELISSEEKEIRSILKKIEALEEELRLARAEKEGQVPSGSRNQKTISRVNVWQCCQCGMSGMLKEIHPQCTEHNCQHARCKNCIVFTDRVGPV